MAQVAQNSVCANTFGRVEYSTYLNAFWYNRRRREWKCQSFVPPGNSGRILVAHSPARMVN